MIRSPLFLRTILVILLAAGFGACAGDRAPDLGPPEGWQGTDSRWWRADADTALFFRDLESLESMDVSRVDMDVAEVNMSGPFGVPADQLVHAVKRSLLPLYRNEPEIVDSLFERYVTPEVRNTPPAGSLGDYVEGFKRRGYELIRSHFREPLVATRLGTDIPVPYPDSLRERSIGGSVRLQVYTNEEGEPLAADVLGGVHPVLDALALNAISQMRWRPAYLLRRGSWRAIPSWTIINVTFQG